MHGMMLHPIMANTCLHPILAFSLALYMPAGFLLYFNNCKNVKHFFFLISKLMLNPILEPICLHLTLAFSVTSFIHWCCHKMALETQCFKAALLHPILVNCIAASNTMNSLQSIKVNTLNIRQKGIKCDYTHFPTKTA